MNIQCHSVLFVKDIDQPLIKKCYLCLGNQACDIPIVVLEVCFYVLCLCCCVQAFNPDNEYHFKNRMKACQRNWAEVFGEEANMFAVSPSNTYQKVRETPQAP